jgi:hypothetical protein
MSESILEQIAAWLKSALAGITVAAGYHQTLSVSRSMEEFLAGRALTDLSMLVALSGVDGAVAKISETLDTDHPTITWWQRFDLFVHVLGRVGTALGEDTRIARIVADIHKRLGVELAAHVATDGPYCGGLADAIELLPWEIGVSPTAVCTVVNVPVGIRYTVLTHNLYQQP